jgi:hypothetical protein
MPVQNYGAIMQGAADLTAMPANAFAQGQSRRQAQDYRNSLLGMDQQQMAFQQQQYGDKMAAQAAQDEEHDQAVELIKAKRFDEAMLLDPELTEQFMRGAGLDPQTVLSRDKLAQDKSQFDARMGIDQQQFNARMAFDRQQEARLASGGNQKPGYGSPQPGVNPQTGKPDQFIVDDAGGIKWLGVSPVPSAQESTAQVASTKKAQSSKDVLAILDEAEPIISQATGSYGGYVVDQAARVFGASTDGAKATAKLKALQAALMLKMPRMEGPQSNLDVQLYREAAGQIGDPTVPADTKLAAVQSIRSLNEKYAGVAPSGGAKPPSGPKPGDVVKGYRFKGGDPSKKENWVKQ